jgi:hypothetical protein
VLRRDRQRSLAQIAQYEKNSRKVSYIDHRATTRQRMMALRSIMQRQPMEKCIQRGNIALFKRRLSETCDEAERVAIAKLLADVVLVD